MAVPATPAPTERIQPTSYLARMFSVVERRDLRFVICDCPSDSTLPAVLKVFQQHGVTDVVRVCEPTYATAPLAAAGITVHDLPFRDGGVPSSAHLARFLAIVRSPPPAHQPAPGAPKRTIAVHCIAGLGRAPLMVAVALIEDGMPALDAVEYIRSRRRGAFNTAQVKFLDAYKPTSSSSAIPLAGTASGAMDGMVRRLRRSRSHDSSVVAADGAAGGRPASPSVGSMWRRMINSLRRRRSDPDALAASAAAAAPAPAAAATTAGSAPAPERYALAMGVSALAGLSTAVGAASVWFGSLQNPRFLAINLALAAGVMLYVSVVELFRESVVAYEEVWPAHPKRAYAAATGTFFAGIVFTVILDAVVHKFQDAMLGEDAVDHHAPPMSVPPAAVGTANAAAPVVKDTAHRVAIPVSASAASESDEVTAALGLVPTTDSSSASLPIATPPLPVAAADAEPRHRRPTRARSVSPDSHTDSVVSLTGSVNRAAAAAGGAPALTEDAEATRARLLRTALITGLAITIHNLPEGLTTFVSMAHSPASGLPLAVAIAIHNIPEGTCVAVPILYATGSRWRAFLWGTVTGLTEPLGAAIGWAILAGSGADQHTLTAVYAVLFGAIAGCMTYVSVGELLPTALAYHPAAQKEVIASVFVGMAIMASSLVLFAMAEE
ncbi:hypothetical protein H9P43_009545 [Blastocladiella emersonii ATCC 22665]|nr:hypothetical protein H9P43_009545 [Blastocladiella emersonii ATCC 22665]